MVFNLPAHGETPWDTKLNDSINAVKATADAAETPTGAQSKADAAKAFAIQRANHTGTQTADTITDGTTNKAYTATEKTKLSGIATGATANSTDAFLLSRANHTGTQTLSTISDAGTAAAANTGTASGQVPVLGTGGVLAPARLGSGTPASGTYVDGATGAWTTLPAGGGTGVGLSVRGPRIPGRFYGASLPGMTDNDTGNFPSGRLYCTPFLNSESLSFDRICIYVPTAGAAGTVLRLGIYTVSETHAGPDTLVVDSGSSSIAAVAELQLTISTTLAPGAYWLVLVHNDTGGTVRFRQTWGSVTPPAWNGSPYSAAPNTFAPYFTGYDPTVALPSTATRVGETWLTAGNVPSIFLRKA